MDFLTRYSTRRLLGEHVPYPVEAWPEGNQRHLAAESALYCRIFTEGLFGIRPSGLRSFTATPRLPRNWERMALCGVHAFESVFDLVVTRAGTQLRIDTVRDGKTIDSQTVHDGETVTVSFRTS
jgi:cellobiose phosphorylase